MTAKYQSAGLAPAKKPRGRKALLAASQSSFEGGPEVPDALPMEEEESLLAGVPAKTRGRKKHPLFAKEKDLHQVNVRMSMQLKRQFSSVAASSGMTLSAFVMQAFTAFERARPWEWGFEVLPGKSPHQTQSGVEPWATVTVYMSDAQQKRIEMLARGLDGMLPVRVSMTSLLMNAIRWFLKMLTAHLQDSVGASVADLVSAMEKFKPAHT